MAADPGEYMGTKNTTKSGVTCMSWHQNWIKNPIPVMPDDNDLWYQGVENYCRKPVYYPPWAVIPEQPWCFVDINIAEECVIPKCGKYMFHIRQFPVENKGILYAPQKLS